MGNVEQRCICCGESVVAQGIAAQNIGNPVKNLQNSPTNSAWPLFANIGNPVKALQNAGNQFFTSQSPKSSANLFASQNVMASQNAHVMASHDPFASQNVMATHDVMASQNVLASVNV